MRKIRLKVAHKLKIKLRFETSHDQADLGHRKKFFLWGAGEDWFGASLARLNLFMIKKIAIYSDDRFAACDLRQELIDEGPLSQYACCP